jgi:hypothetical protein
MGVELKNAMKKLVHQHIKKRKIRLHMTRNASLEINDREQKLSDKPNGLWYGIGPSWIEWCLSETEWVHPFVHEVIVNENRILKIDNIEDFEKFESEYQTPNAFLEGFPIPRSSRLSFYINYPKLAEKYDGIEISPYLHEKRLDSVWYYGWDCASGCIWNTNAIKELKLFAAYDEKRDEFVGTSLQVEKTGV